MTYLLMVALCGGDWSSFRDGGPNIAPGSVPATWSPDENVAWQRELPGYGQSSPVLHGDMLYVTAVVGPRKESCVVLALDPATGEERWRYQAEAATTAASNYAVSRAAPTPLADEAGVVAFFEGGNLVALTADGELRWQRRLTDDYGPFENHHGLGSSPAQSATHVFMNIEHRGPSYPLAVDKATGETAWKADWPSGMAWTSPVVVTTAEGRTLALIVHNHPSGADADDFLTAVELDSDAVVHDGPIGASDVTGHFGHNGVAADPSGRYAFVTAPGDGVVRVVDLSDMDTVADVSVGGGPTAVIAVGRPAADH